MNKDVSQTNVEQNFLDQVLGSMPGGVFIYRDNESHELLYANDRFLSMLGYESLEELWTKKGRSLDALISPGDHDRLFAEIERQTQSGPICFVDFQGITKTHGSRYMEIFSRLVKHPEWGPVYYVFVVDSAAKYLTYSTDRLTGLPGQRRFLEYARKWFKLNDLNPSAPPIAILYFNLRHFKAYNLRFGLEAGDLLLQRIADLLKTAFPNDFISRFSDDHFAVLTYDVDLSNRVIDVHKQLLSVKMSMPLDMKIGAYHVEHSDTDPSRACDLAKLACDSIKNRLDIYSCRYTPTVQRAAQVGDYVIDHLDEAIEKGYIKVYFQPVIRSISKTLCGLEALARWVDPVYGFLKPNEFIPPLEDSRQLYKLDLHILELICQRQRHCLDNGIPAIPISFNLSRMDFLTCDIYAEILRITEKYRIPHSLLCIEITESMFVQNAGEITVILEQFRSAGFQVWMDDFGSGYSSLNALKDYHFDELKIDMAFLSSFTQRSKDIIEATVSMAKTIGIRTLAEGVETEEQFEFLKSIGCEKIQGYFFGKPLPFEEMVAHVRSRDIPVETPEMAAYYAKAGEENFITTKSMALLECDENHKFHYLFANDAYKSVLASVGSPTLAASESRMNEPESLIVHRVERLEKKVFASDRAYAMTYTVDDKYLWLKLQCIGRYQGRYLLLSQLLNITTTAARMEQLKVEGLAHDIYHLYNAVVIVDLDRGTCEPLVYWKEYNQFKTGRTYCLRRTVEALTKLHVPREDQARFRKFIDPETLRFRLANSPTGNLTDFFRTLTPNGYVWCQHVILSVPDTNHAAVLHTVKPAIPNDSLMESSLLKLYAQTKKGNS